MASTAYNDLSQLTPDNLAIKDLRELLFLEVLKFGAISETLSLQYGVQDKKIVGGIGEFNILGESRNMCNPTFNATKLNTQEKRWELGTLAVLEQMCADDFIETVARFAMKTGTDKADLTQTDLLNYIVEPRLKEAVEKAVWRYFWFGDKDAVNVTDGGNITNGIDVKFFTPIDGLFKRLFALTAGANNKQRVTISANAETTYANQRAKMFDSGVATKVFDDLIYNASMKLRQRTDKIVLCTQSYADALASDIKKTNKGSDLQWESLFDGLVSATKYNGQTILALPIWDEMIAAYENKGTALNCPHRVLFAAKDVLWGGIESANDFMPNLKIWFSDDDQVNKILGREDLGTLIWEDELIQFAY